MLELLNCNLSAQVYIPEYTGSYQSIFSFTSNLGDFSSTGDIAHDQFSSVLNGDPVVRTYNNFTVNSGHTVTPTLRCKGLYLNILGDLIVNGTLSMTARGAKAEGKYVIIDKMSKLIYFSNEQPDNQLLSSEQYSLINKIGGLSSTYSLSGNIANSGINGACGAGGHHYNTKAGSGTSFSGGAGAGAGCTYYSGDSYTHADGYPAEENGGAGGKGWRYGGENAAYGGGSGAGNPAGTHPYSTSFKGQDGTGGLMILFVQGNIIIGSSGSIQSNGSKGGNGDLGVDGSRYGSGAGGGSGGGAIHIFHKKDISDISKIFATGGLHGNNAYWSRYATNGGNGTVNLVQI